MKFSVLSSLFLLASMVSADNTNSQDIAFLSVLVGDFKSNGLQYVNFVRTASSVPPELTLLAMKVATYTDDSYTTILNDPNLNIAALRSFATELPWFSQLTQKFSSTETLSGMSGSGSSFSSTATSGSSSVSDDSSTAAKSTGGVSRYAPHGALLGLVALLIM